MSKINKLGKSTFVIAILSFILVAVLAFGGTYAYFSDTSKTATSGNITLGTLVLTDADFADGAKIVSEGYAVPNQEIINGVVETTVTSNINYYVRAVISVTTTLAEAHDNDGEGDKCVVAGDGVDASTVTCTQADKDLTNPVIYSITDSEGKMILGSDGQSLANDSKWFVVENNDITYIYLSTKQLANAENTYNSGAEFSFTINASVNPEVGTGESQHWMGATYSVSIYFQVCQADFVGEGNTNPGAESISKDTLSASAWKTIDPTSIPATQG